MPWTSSPSGFSLVETMVGIALLGIVVMASAEIQSHSSRATRSAELRRARAEIRTNVAENLDCNRSLRAYGNPPSCQGRLVNLYGVNGRVMIRRSGRTEMNGYNVRARCQSNGVSLEVSRRTSSGDWAKDPLDGRELSWTHPRANLYSGIGLCHGEFGEQSLKMLSGQIRVAPAAPAGTSSGPVLWSVTVATPWRAKEAIGTPTASGSTNSSLACTITGYEIHPRSVIFRGTWQWGVHTHAVSCLLGYMVTAE